jgi:hypothetical protein
MPMESRRAIVLPARVLLAWGLAALAAALGAGRAQAGASGATAASASALPASASASESAPAPASAWGQSASVPPRALLRHLVCHRAAQPLRRYVEITAVMRPVSGTRHMRMRFWLLARLSGQSGFHPLEGGELGRWISPRDPNLGQRPGDRWIVHEPVRGLAPGAYRFRVQFRWLGAGSTLASAARSSGMCLQP